MTQLTEIKVKMKCRAMEALSYLMTQLGNELLNDFFLSPLLESRLYQIYEM